MKRMWRIPLLSVPCAHKQSNKPFIVKLLLDPQLRIVPTWLTEVKINY